MADPDGVAPGTGANRRSQALALRRLGWSDRRIEESTSVRGEAVRSRLRPDDLAADWPSPEVQRIRKSSH